MHEAHSHHQKERLAPLKLAHFHKVQEMQEIKENFFGLKNNFQNQYCTKFRVRTNAIFQLNWCPSSWKGVLKNNFGKKNFMQSMGRLRMHCQKNAVFFFGGKGFFSPFVPKVFSNLFLKMFQIAPWFYPIRFCPKFNFPVYKLKRRNLRSTFASILQLGVARGPSIRHGSFKRSK